MKQVSRSDTRVSKGQITRNAIELQVPERPPLALFCLIVCKLNIHATVEVSNTNIDNMHIEAYKMISSTALPKVTFISAPIVSPISAATLSVA